MHILEQRLDALIGRLLYGADLGEKVFWQKERIDFLVERAQCLRDLGLHLEDQLGLVEQLLHVALELLAELLVYGREDVAQDELTNLTDAASFSLVNLRTVLVVSCTTSWVAAIPRAAMDGWLIG